MKEHLKADELLLGYSIPLIHKLIDDIEALKEYGAKHRIMKHNEKTLLYINEVYGKKAFNTALLHILIDNHIINQDVIRRWFYFLGNKKDKDVT